MDTKKYLLLFLIVSIAPAALGQECDLNFKTYDQTAWGTSASGNNSAAYRNAYFAAAFPQGVRIGNDAGHTAIFTTSRAVQLYLPSAGTASVLNESSVNATQTSAGIFGGEVLSLALNVGFDAADASFSPSGAALENLTITEGICAGMTVRQVLDIGNYLLSGQPSTFTPAQIQNCTAQINRNFHNGSVNHGYLACATANESANAPVNGSAQAPANDTTGTVNVTSPNTTAVNATNSTMPPNLAASLSIARWYPKGSHYVFICNATGFIPSNYSWYFGDGEKLLQIKNSNVYHIYKTLGDYDLRCVAHGPQSAQATMAVHVG